MAALDFKCRHFHQHSAGEMGQDFQKQTPTTNLLSRAQHIPSIQEDVAGGEKNKEKRDREKSNNLDDGARTETGRADVIASFLPLMLLLLTPATKEVVEAPKHAIATALVVCSVRLNVCVCKRLQFLHGICGSFFLLLLLLPPSPSPTVLSLPCWLPRLTISGLRILAPPNARAPTILPYLPFELLDNLRFRHRRYGRPAGNKEPYHYYCSP